MSHRSRVQSPQGTCAHSKQEFGRLQSAEEDSSLFVRFRPSCCGSVTFNVFFKGARPTMWFQRFQRQMSCYSNRFGVSSYEWQVFAVPAGGKAWEGVGQSAQGQGARFLDSGSWSRGVTVSALDSESSDRGSIPRGFQVCHKACFLRGSTALLQVCLSLVQVSFARFLPKVFGGFPSGLSFAAFRLPSLP